MAKEEKAAEAAKEKIFPKCALKSEETLKIKHENADRLILEDESGSQRTVSKIEFEAKYKRL